MAFKSIKHFEIRLSIILSYKPLSTPDKMRFLYDYLLFWHNFFLFGTDLFFKLYLQKVKHNIH